MTQTGENETVAWGRRRQGRFGHVSGFFSHFRADAVSTRIIVAMAPYCLPVIILHRPANVSYVPVLNGKVAGKAMGT